MKKFYKLCKKYQLKNIDLILYDLKNNPDTLKVFISDKRLLKKLLRLHLENEKDF